MVVRRGLWTLPFAALFVLVCRYPGSMAAADAAGTFAWNLPKGSIVAVSSPAPCPVSYTLSLIQDNWFFRGPGGTPAAPEIAGYRF